MITIKPPFTITAEFSALRPPFKKIEFCLASSVPVKESKVITSIPSAGSYPEKTKLFILKAGSKWIEEAKKQPAQCILFGEFWFEGELCFLFADTNTGKSILAVQIGNAITKGIPIGDFLMLCRQQMVLYMDFELSGKQFERRYTDLNGIAHDFDSAFVRIEINPDAEIPKGKTFEEYLVESIETAVIKTGARVLIIDNITYLRTETEKAKDALPLMKELKRLKKKYSLSILCLAHTPKRDPSKPITKNDLAGSKMLINFCDSAFAIGESSKDKDLRYIKQIKQRNTELLYGADNVCVCQIIKPSSFLQFEFVEFSTENAHLREDDNVNLDSIKERILTLSSQGRSQREISKEVGRSPATVNRILKLFSVSTCSTVSGIEHSTPLNTLNTPDLFDLNN
jgi:hypothetical protein